MAVMWRLIIMQQVDSAANTILAQHLQIQPLPYSPHKMTHT